MNERIRELAAQAGIGYHGESLTIIQDELPETVLSRFAELIVRECIPFVGDPTSEAVQKMMKHFFGVAE